MNVLAHPIELKGLLPPYPARHRRSSAPIGQILMDLGQLDHGDILKAVAMRGREDVRIGEILVANGFVSQAQLYNALSLQFGCSVADLAADPPSRSLARDLPLGLCLRHGIVPWKRMGTRKVLVTDDPSGFSSMLSDLPPDYADALMAIAPRDQIENALISIHGAELVRTSETMTPAPFSSRSWRPAKVRGLLIAAAAALAASALIAPAVVHAGLLAVSVAVLALVSLLRLAAFAVVLARPEQRDINRHGIEPAGEHQALRLPKVSILVPLFHETAIAGRLVRRLNKLNYPGELLDIILIVEREDKDTMLAASASPLPGNFRVIEVPEGTLRTKPRALNFALSFCRGDIVGVIDAEDAPEPDQLFKVARRFASAGPEVACLQGVLEFHNAGDNWLSRCFAIEYAAWFKIMLSGLEQLGLAIPLGGTTLYFRRTVLERIGGWDAHNVTEDADLGVRLARFGYRAELFATTTQEEANCRLGPWIRQRSRWLKGYAMTWIVHMRSPARLWRDLGAWRFTGFQILFLGTLLQFLLAPLLWYFWLWPLGWVPTVPSAIPQSLMTVAVIAFLASELLSFAVAAYATRDRAHRWLWPWIPSLLLYYPLATLALFRGLWELAARPFYWDKTEHGISAHPEAVTPMPRQSSAASRMRG